MMWLWILIVGSILVPTIGIVKAYRKLRKGDTLVDLFRKLHWILFVPVINIVCCILIGIALLIEFIEDTPIK